MSDKSAAKVWAYIFAFLCGGEVLLGGYGGAALAAMIAFINMADMIAYSVSRPPCNTPEKQP